MPNLTINNNDVGSALIHVDAWADELLTFTGAGTILEGTLLARDSATKKLIPYVKGGTTNENGIVKTFISYEAAATGAGDVAVRVPLSGRVRSNKLIIAADGDGSNVDSIELDGLRDYNIAAESVSELNTLDNQ